MLKFLIFKRVFKQNMSFLWNPEKMDSLPLKFSFLRLHRLWFLAQLAVHSYVRLTPPSFAPIASATGSFARQPSMEPGNLASLDGGSTSCKSCHQALAKPPLTARFPIPAQSVPSTRELRRVVGDEQPATAVVVAAGTATLHFLLWFSYSGIILRENITQPQQNRLLEFYWSSQLKLLH